LIPRCRVHSQQLMVGDRKRPELLTFRLQNEGGPVAAMMIFVVHINYSLNFGILPCVFYQRPQ